MEPGGIIRLSYEILGDSCLLVCGGTAAGCVVGQFRLRVRAGAVHRNVDVARYVLCPVFPAAGFFCPSSSGCHRSLRRCRGRGGGMGVDVACQQLYPRRFRPGSFPLAVLQSDFSARFVGRVRAPLRTFVAVASAEAASVSEYHVRFRAQEGDLGICGHRLYRIERYGSVAPYGRRNGLSHADPHLPMGTTAG